MKRLTLFTAIFLILFPYSTALADYVQITIESYANPALGVKSTIVETTDPYDQNDTDDQLRMAYEAMAFAFSSDGWNFSGEGFDAATNPICGGGSWGFEVNGDAFKDDPAYYEDLLGGYRVSENPQAWEMILRNPENGATMLVFHTDVWCSKQPPHMFCDGAYNYGHISQVMAGYFMQCAVQEWGTFTVETVPAPPSLESRVEALEEKVMTLEGQVGAITDDYIELQDRLMQLEQDLQDHSHDYLTGKGEGHNNTLRSTGPPTFPAAPTPVPAGR